jgi:hypothetical protein
VKVNSPGIHENNLDIENYKQNGHQEIFDGKRKAGIALRLYAALKIFVFDAAFSFGAKPMGRYHGGYHKPQSNKQHDKNRNIGRWTGHNSGRKIKDFFEIVQIKRYDFLSFALSAFIFSFFSNKTKIHHAAGGKHENKQYHRKFHDVLNFRNYTED